MAAPDPGEGGALMPATRILIVGELNPYGDDPAMALYPRPATASGGRLMGLLGVTERQYLAFGRRNLCTGRWSDRRAREAAGAVAAEVSSGALDLVVCLGSRVREAFARHVTTWERASAASLALPGTWMFGGALGSPRFAFVPHPSGMCRVWDDHRSRAYLRATMAVLAPDVAWGAAGGAYERATREEARQ